MEAKRDETTIHHVEVCGDNGCWWDMVIAETREIAIEKVKVEYKSHHKNITVSIINTYDYIIK